MNITLLKNECQNSGYPMIQNHTDKQVGRGLINAIGSISKTLFGTLDNDDLSLINKNIDGLFNEAFQNKISSIIQNQTIIMKQILTDDNFESLTTKLIEQSTKLQKAQNTLMFDETLLTLEILYSEFADKINEFYNIIILGKNGIIDTTLINIDQFIRAYKDVTKTKSVTIAERKLSNFQTIIDISKLTAVIIDNAIIYRIEASMLEEHE
ncbi:uncharacterized protein LOC122534690 [Frieseomelitta varia]|uniref:uncharacterized protein LOC122534690 n=1 Tax=Frieseomelitta varia TaxID=561572 RepID=UPI001CB693CF|nr:uncharacterized protein LOC122534690 [Frieseomelitta varia]